MKNHIKNEKKKMIKDYKEFALRSYIYFVLEHDENFRKRFSTVRLPQGMSRGDVITEINVALSF